MSSRSPAFGAILAQIGDYTITSEQFETALKALGNQGLSISTNPDLKKRFLDHLINSRIVAEHAKSEGFESDPKFQAHLADMKNQLLAGDYMDQKLEKQMTEANMKKYFNENKKKFSKKEVRASHIVLATEDEAKNALAEARKPNTDFDSYAKSVSKDKTVDLGFFGRGRMTAELESAAFATPNGKIFDKPIKTMFGWHVLKVTGTKGSDSVNYKDVRDQVKSQMRSSLQEDFVRSLRDKIKVVVNQENLKDVKLGL
jgi:peptidyl-prolyl cis-trans isomerase C